MLGEGYISKQIYSYNDLQELERILKETNTINYIIHKQENVIEYQIDRKQWIRLSDLIYWIEQGLVRIHVGQFLDLFEKILQYIQQLKSKKIQHEYLDSNRIWLVLDNQNYLDIVQTVFNYSIVLTGYQCPLYEKKDYLAQDYYKIFPIFQKIILNFYSFKTWLIRDSSKVQNIQQIYDQLFDSFNFNNIEKSLQDIKNLKVNNQYITTKQMINCDKEKSQLSLRQKRKKKLKKRLKSLFEIFQNQNQLFVECALETLVPLYNKALKSVQDSIFQKIPKYDQKYIENFRQIIEDQEQKFNNYIEDLTIIKLKESIQKCNELFKFDFSEEFQMLKSEIINEFNKKKILKHFENSIHYYQNETVIYNQKVEISKQMIQDLINARVKLQLENKILQMIIELI